jgi:hypothetical protein
MEMPDELPLACSLNAHDLQHRLAAINELGKGALVRRETEGGRHRLWFRSDAATRKRLEEIVAAEADCCSFLDLALDERDSDLILSVGAAPADGDATTAAELAAGFAQAFGNP